MIQLQSLRKGFCHGYILRGFSKLHCMLHNCENPKSNKGKNNGKMGEIQKKISSTNIWIRILTCVFQTINQKRDSFLVIMN